jgi:hypothetical protein
MKRQWGRWQVDTESSTLVNRSSREIRVFTLPPGGTLTPSQVQAWIIRAYPQRQPIGKEIEELSAAVGELLAIPDLTAGQENRLASLKLGTDGEKSISGDGRRT